MKYSPECVAAFEAKFKPNPRLVQFSFERGRYIGIQQKPSDPIDQHDILSFGFTAQLEGFAANWERVRELEEAIALHKTVTEKMPYPTSSDKKLWKLLEKGNE